MSAPKAKTNAARLLERLGIPYELREYEVDPDDLAAESVARKIGMPAEQVFKTLVARGDRNGVCLAVIPGDAQLDLKALARATGDRKVDTVPLKDVQPLTGYIRGGVTALAGKKDYPTYLDETARLFDDDLRLRRGEGPANPGRPRRLHPGRRRQGRRHREGQGLTRTRRLRIDESPALVVEGRARGRPAACGPVRVAGTSRRGRRSGGGGPCR